MTFSMLKGKRKGPYTLCFLRGGKRADKFYDLKGIWGCENSYSSFRAAIHFAVLPYKTVRNLERKLSPFSAIMALYSIRRAQNES